MDTSDIITLWTTTRAHSDDLWMLYLVLTGAVLGFTFTSAFQKAPAIPRLIVAFGFAAFAFANWNAMRENVALNNELVALLRFDAKRDPAVSKALSEIGTNPVMLMVVFHLILDFVVLALIALPHRMFLRNRND